MTAFDSLPAVLERVDEPRLRPYLLPAVVLSFLSLLVFFPLFEPGYVLTLDMIFAPNTDYLRFGLETKGPLYYGRLPFLLLLDVATLVLTDWLVQKLLLFTLPVCAGLSMVAVCQPRGRLAALFAAVLYAINPFVYVRLLAGHWYFLLGYAFLPLAVVAVYRYLSFEEGGSLSRAVGWTTLVCVFDPHTAVLLAIAGGCYWFVGVVEAARSRGPGTQFRPCFARLTTFTVVAAGVNAYWLLPAVAGAVGGGSRLSTISGADLRAFSAAPTLFENTPLSVAMLWGFWRGAATTTADLLPVWVVGVLFAGLLYLAVTGAVDGWGDSFVRGTALTAVVAFVLALGVSTPVSEPLFRGLAETVPVFRGMRDSQKFVGLLVFAYAVLGARGVDEFVPADFPSSDRSFDATTAVRVGLAVLLLLTPVFYAAPVFAGFSGQVDSTTYPNSWHTANDRIEASDPSGRLLFLPWHQYLSLSFTERRVANPAPMFFDRPVVAGENIEVGGIETRASDPTHVQVREGIEEPSASDFGDRLADVGIEYVVLAHEADYRQYDSLATHADFSVTFRGDGITVYENEAYSRATGMDPPRRGPPIPWTALVVGVVVTVASVVLGVHRQRS